jgi:tetratricopeptide (TPR) repeat protein
LLQEFESVRRNYKNYQQGIQLYPTSAEIYFFLALGLRDFGRTQEAIAFATEASQLLPNNLILKLEKQFLLPIIYETEEEVDFYRDQFTQSLEELQQISLDTPEAKSSALWL